MKILFLFGLVVSFSLNAQNIQHSLEQDLWNARWITVTGEPASGYGVFLFRKIIELSAKPDSFIMHVSGDNRYKLF